jgi:hypothetical protein
MGTALVSALGFAVFGMLWLAHQDWFDLLPRGARRAANTAGAAVVLGACLFVPSAFRDGLARFADYASAQITDQLRHALDRVDSIPKPAASPAPARTRSP